MSPPVWRGRPLALVVDDSRASRSALRRILTNVGFEVLEAEHGGHALTLLHAEGAIELVLVDWHMPVMDGVTLIQAIRKEPRWATLPIVMVSAEVDQKRIARAVLAGADEYVMKPFDGPMLIGKLRLLGMALPVDSEAGLR